MTKSLKNPKISELRTDFFKPWGQGRSSHQTTKNPNLTQPNGPNPSMAQSTSFKGSSFPEKSPRGSFFSLFHGCIRALRLQPAGTIRAPPPRAGTTTCSSTTGLALLPPKLRCKLRKAARLTQGTETAGIWGPKGVSVSDSHPSSCSWDRSSPSRHCRQLV